MTHRIFRALLFVGGGLGGAADVAAMPASEQSRLLTRADVYSRTAETCPAAARLVRRFRAECTGAICAAAQPTLAAIRERCAASVDVVIMPSDGRLEWDAWPVGDRVWLSTPRIAAVWPDGTRRSRALCVTPGEASLRVELAREGDARLVDERQPAVALAAAHERAGLLHLDAAEPCEAAAAFEASTAVVAAPHMLLNVARAYDLQPGGCHEAAAAYDGLLAACPDCEAAAAARVGREAARARCAVEPRKVAPAHDGLAGQPPRAPAPRPKPKPKPARRFPSDQLALAGGLTVLGGIGILAEFAGDSGREPEWDSFGRHRGRDSAFILSTLTVAVGLWLCLDALIADDPYGPRIPGWLEKARDASFGPTGVLIRF